MAENPRIAERPLTEWQRRGLVALLHLGGRDRRGWRGGWSASDVAELTGLGRGIRRHGRGAVKGSWSGFVPPALPVGATLRTLANRGLLSVSYGHRSRGRYRLSSRGITAASKLWQEGVRPWGFAARLGQVRELPDGLERVKVFDMEHGIAARTVEFRGDLSLPWQRSGIGRAGVSCWDTPQERREFESFQIVET